MQKQYAQCYPVQPTSLLEQWALQCTLCITAIRWQYLCGYMQGVLGFLRYSGRPMNSTLEHEGIVQPRFNSLENVCLAIFDVFSVKWNFIYTLYLPSGALPTPLMHPLSFSPSFRVRLVVTSGVSSSSRSLMPSNWYVICAGIQYTISWCVYKYTTLRPLIASFPILHAWIL